MTQKTFATLGALLLMSFTAMAQESNQSTLKRESAWALQPTLSLTSFQIAGGGDMPSGARAGLGVGGVAQLHYSRDFDFEMGLGYLQAGNKEAYVIVGNDEIVAENEITLDYITVPLAASWNFIRFGEREQNKAFLKGGITPSFLTAAKQRIMVFGASAEADIKDQTNGFDLMARVALGGTYEFSTDAGLAYELSYVRGTQKVFKEATGTNEGILASISYSIAM